MQCPTCRLINPDTALRCDCGYDFQSRQMERPYQDLKTPPPARSDPPGVRPLTVIAAIAVLVLGFFGIDPVGLLSDPQAVVELASGMNAGTTLANYERLQTGITYAQACELLGKTGTETSRIEMTGYVIVMYSWQGNGLANMNAMFQNDKLISKAQFGLR